MTVYAPSFYFLKNTLTYCAISCDLHLTSHISKSRARRYMKNVWIDQPANIYEIPPESSYKTLAPPSSTSISSLPFCYHMNFKKCARDDVCSRSAAKKLPYQENAVEDAMCDIKLCFGTKHMLCLPCQRRQCHVCVDHHRSQLYFQTSEWLRLNTFDTVWCTCDTPDHRDRLYVFRTNLTRPKYMSPKSILSSIHEVSAGWKNTHVPRRWKVAYKFSCSGSLLLFC